MANDNTDAANFEDFVETLSQFDSEGKGTVRASELRHILTVLGNPLTENEVNQVFAGQVDSNGEINIVEFVTHLSSPNVKNSAPASSFSTTGNAEPEHK